MTHERACQRKHRLATSFCLTLACSVAHFHDAVVRLAIPPALQEAKLSRHTAQGDFPFSRPGDEAVTGPSAKIQAQFSRIVRGDYTIDERYVRCTPARTPLATAKEAR